jgi:ADP-ribosyltransferase exoenzyme
MDPFLVHSIVLYQEEKHRNMTDDCKEILQYYSGNHYKFINDFLLMDFEDEFKKKYKYYDEPFCQDKIQRIDDCFLSNSVAPINQDDTMFLYRGVKTSVPLQVGESFLLENYTSTTTNLGVARRFTSDSKQANACCLYRLRLSRGIPYIDMRPFSKVKTEDEILLPRNLIMTYQGDSTIRDDKTNRNVTVNDFILTRLNEASMDMSRSGTYKSDPETDTATTKKPKNNTLKKKKI